MDAEGFESSSPSPKHPAERIELSREERRKLVSIERGMLRDDPRWVTRFEARFRKGNTPPRWRLFGR